MTDDERLIALIDDELDDEERVNLSARLVADEPLRARFEALSRSREELASALDALLDQAPVERLRAAIPPAGAARGRRTRFPWLELAAAFVLGLVIAGAAAWMTLGRSAETWRDAVIEYAALYTRDTFAFPSPDQALAARQLAAVATKIGLDLTPQSVDVRGLAYKIAINLAFAEKPLVEIAYTDDKGDPALVCITADGASDAPVRTEMRGGFSTASWSRKGRSFMVVAQQPEARVGAFADTLAARF